MRTVFAQYNMYRNSIDIYTHAGCMLRIDCDKAEDGIQALKAWFDKIGTPTRLEQLGIDNKTLAEIVDNAAQTAIKAKVEKTYTKEAIEAIFALAK